ncbi:MAG: hypothetical protein R3F62_00400 [Planctomycetota bacterium]
MTQPRRIAVVGIDGGGKSSLVRRFLERAQGSRVQVLTCPLYHDTPNTPLGELSRHLATLSEAADQVGSVPLKAAALYLQMSLYGLVEGCLVEAFRPQVLLSERHAIVGTLAYGALYAPWLAQAPSAPQDPAQIEAVLGQLLGADGLAQVLGFVTAEGERLGRAWDLGSLGAAVAADLALPWPERIAALCRAYRTQLPDAVAILDLPGQVARQRIAGRGEVTEEMHETADMLETLRQAYLGVGEALRAQGVEVHVVDATGDEASLDRAVSALHAG